MPRLAALLLLLPALAAAVTTDRAIPGTSANQEYFARTQALFAFGNRTESSCGPEVASIETCIRSCNRPGLQERSGCCCVATPERSFFVGLRGGCRYRQQLLNFTSRLIYESKPVDQRRRYFDPISCAPVAEAGDDAGSCTCSIQWEAATDELDLVQPLASPTPSTTPGLSPSPRPSSVPPTPSPVSPTRTPSPEPAPTVIDIPTVATSSPSSVDVEPTPAVEDKPAETDMEDGSGSGPVPVPVRPRPPRPSPGSGSGDGSGDGVQETEEPGEGEVDAESTPDMTDDEGMPLLDASGEPVLDGSGEPIIVGDDGDGSATDDAVASAEASVTPEDDGTVCVDEEHLLAAGYDRRHMVHARGVMQRVLCPAVGGLPCGTADHKVRRMGKNVSYKQLCESVRCSHDVKVVNSVYSHLWTETTHEEVTLTMFDARYPERAQKALHSVMHLARRAVERF